MVNAVALLSGGLDSCVALGMWLRDGHRVAECLTADYGQRSAAPEQAAARAVAARFGVSWRALELPWLGDAARRAGSALVPEGGNLPERTSADPGDARSAALVWVPARNVVLLAAAAACAESVGASAVIAGFNREEAATFPDNSEAFVAAMQAALALGTRGPVRVESPTLGMTKREIAGEARALGLRPEDLWSCYAAGPAPCGKCESCVRSARAWAER